MHLRHIWRQDHGRQLRFFLEKKSLAKKKTPGGNDPRRKLRFWEKLSKRINVGKDRWRQDY